MTSPADLAAAQLAAIVQSSHDAIIGKDLAGRVVTWNPAAERLYGYLAQEMLGRPGSVLVFEDDHDLETQLLARIAAGEHVQMARARRRHKSGSTLTVSLSASPIVAGEGEIVGMATSSRDVHELALAESRYQGMLEAAPDAMVAVDGDGTITLVNNQVENLFGYSAAELIGRSVDVLVPLDVRAAHPDLRTAYARNPTNRAMGANNNQLSAQRKDGSTFPADISLGSVRIEGSLVVTAAVRDVSERIAVQRALAESEANLRQLTESVEVAFVLRTLDPPKFLYLSPGFKKIFGYDPMADGLSPSEVMRRLHPDDVERVEQEYWQVARAGGAAQTEYRIISSDGEIRWVRATTGPVRDADGIVRRSAGTAEDITARKVAETAMRKAHAEAETANAAKNEFLSRMSHELRTPLNAVLGFAQLLELDDLTTGQRDAVQYILRGGRHLLGLIDDVLDITKIETDRLDVSMEPVEIADLVAEAVELMRPMADTMDITVRFVEQDGPRQYVHADRRRLRQVLLNLLSNAIKYNLRGGSVDISFQGAAEDMVDILVRDTGRGIRHEDLPRLFTPFDRLGAQAIGIEGTGVGLALSHRLMTNMGGSLRARSELNVGSTFIASIPTATPLPLAGDLEQAKEGAGNGPAEVEPVLEPTRLLLYVEDNDSNVELMISLLSRRPTWRMVVARTGAAGLAAVQAEIPDLVLLDVHLPDMDGIEVLGSLLSDPGVPELPVVVVSADANPHQIQRLLLAGAHEYLTKPLDVSKILALLDFYERRGRRSGASEGRA